jgi:hypothetical protein
MTGGDVLVLAPWLIFGAGVAVICLQLIRARRRSRCIRPGQAAHPDDPDCPESRTALRQNIGQPSSRSRTGRGPS